MHVVLLPVGEGILSAAAELESIQYYRQIQCEVSTLRDLHMCAWDGPFIVLPCTAMLAMNGSILENGVYRLDFGMNAHCTLPYAVVCSSAFECAEIHFNWNARQFEGSKIHESILPLFRTLLPIFKALDFKEAEIFMPSCVPPIPLDAFRDAVGTTQFVTVDAVAIRANEPTLIVLPNAAWVKGEIPKLNFLAVAILDGSQLDEVAMGIARRADVIICASTPVMGARGTQIIMPEWYFKCKEVLDIMAQVLGENMNGLHGNFARACAQYGPTFVVPPQESE